MRKVCWGLSLALAATLFAGLPASADEVKGRWRWEFHVGGFDPGDEIPSQAADGMTVFDADRWNSVPDPRPDSAGLLAARLDTSLRYEVRASYGLAAWKSGELVLDLGLGRFQSRITNIELSYALDVQDVNYTIFDPISEQRIFVPGCESIGNPNPGQNCIFFSSDAGSSPGNPHYENWRYEEITGGELTMYPLSMNVLARFRPTKRFNPYVGGGLGYLFVEFDPSQRWKDVADQLDASIVDHVIHGQGLSGAGSRLLLGKPHDVKRPEISTPDTLYFELRGGAEWQWRPKTALFVETRFNWAQDNIEITADGKSKFGVGTPVLQLDNVSNPAVFPQGGRPAYITRGGLRVSAVDPRTGQRTKGPWPGEYYLNGGTLDYGGWMFSTGIRFSL
ncbi:MAG: hypothetical protein KBD01_01405 [Acidobacteria bacterium]|nr:hypothetical protein [Acidobacteriota bacterium]